MSTTRVPVTVQAIHYTTDPRAWHAFAADVGWTAAFPPAEVWSEFDGDGVLAIHAVEPGHAKAGTTEIHLLTPDLDALAASVEAAGFAVTDTTLDDIGPMITVTSGSGVAITASRSDRVARTGVLVQPIWYDADLQQPLALLTALGLSPHVVSDSGVWHDLRASGGGSVAVHRAERHGVVLGAEFDGDLDTFADRLRAAGHEASVIDEAYNRTLLVTTPEGWQLWINGAQEDFYGYHRVG